MHVLFPFQCGPKELSTSLMRMDVLSDKEQTHIRIQRVVSPLVYKNEGAIRRSLTYYCKKCDILNGAIEQRLAQPQLSSHDVRSLVELLRAFESSLEVAVTRLTPASTPEDILNIEGKKQILTQKARAVLEKTLVAASKNAHIELLIPKISLFVADDHKTALFKQFAPLFQDSKDPTWQRLYLQSMVQNVQHNHQGALEQIDTILEYCETNQLLTELGLCLQDAKFMVRLSPLQKARSQEILGELDVRGEMAKLEELGAILSGDELLSQQGEVFLASLIGNESINQHLLMLKKSGIHSGEPLSQYQQVGLQAALALSYKLGEKQQKMLQAIDTKISYHLSVIAEVIALPPDGAVDAVMITKDQVAKLQKLFIPPGRKLTDEELETLRSLHSLAPLIAMLEGQSDPLGPNQQLFSACKNLLVKSRVLSRMINLSTDARSGDVSFENRLLVQRSKGQNITLGQQIQRLATWSDYHHGATIFKDSQGISHYAHVEAEFMQEEIGLSDFVCQESYRLDWSKLLTDEGKTVLKKAIQLAYKRGKISEIVSPEQFMQRLYQEEFEVCLQEGCERWSKNFTNPLDDKGRRVFSVFKNLQVDSPDAKDSFASAADIKASLLEQKAIFCTEFQMKVTAYCWSRAIKRAGDFIHNKNSPLHIARGAISRPLIPPGTQFSSLHPGRAFRLLEPFVQKVPKSPLLELFVKSSL